jgi:hypothetical protein
LLIAAMTATLESTEPDNGKIYNVTGVTNAEPQRVKVVTVADILATPWLELFVEWIEPSGPLPPGYRFRFCFTVGMPAGSFPIAMAQAGGQGFNVAGGKIWFDKLEVDEIPVCDLTFGSPAYTKTNETNVGLNNGTVTLNATSSFTRQYSKDNAIWQSSNFFPGIPVGTTTFYVRDTNPSGCSISVPVTISAFIPAPDPGPPSPESVLSIDQKPVTSNNFVPWFAGNGLITFGQLTSSNCCWDIPAAYRARTQGKNNLKHALVAVNGEEFTFYMNYSINDPNFADMRLALIDNGGLVADNIATLQRDLFDDGVTYNLYASIELNGIAINRYYKLAIYNTNTGNIIFVSGLVEVLSSDDASCLSTRLRYKSSINLYGFRYEQLPDYYNIHRLRLYRIDEQDETTLVQYRAVSSGQLRNVRYELDRWIALEAYYFDDNAHRATGVFQLHDIVLINDVSYLLKTPHKRSFDPEKALYKGRIEFFEIAFSTANRFNRLGDITIVNGSDFLLGDFGARIKL